METPPDLDAGLPFFAYGLFRPGEIAYFQIAPYVETHIFGQIPGELRSRDGLPILAVDLPGSVSGDLITFRAGQAKLAYERISAMEPSNQYRWTTRLVAGSPANVLAGRSPDKGTEVELEPWTGWTDPYLSVALDAVEEIRAGITAPKLGPHSPESYRLQMAYLMLWTSFERYASLRHGAAGKPTETVERVGTEPGFVAALLAENPQRRTVQSAKDPRHRKVLDPNDPVGSIGYYYQVRCNLAHRGKGAYDDFDRVRSAVDELLPIFRNTVRSAREEAGAIG